MRAEEWSGPWPSYPCGSMSTIPERWPHRSSAAQPGQKDLVECQNLKAGFATAVRFPYGTGLAQELTCLLSRNRAHPQRRTGR